MYMFHQRGQGRRERKCTNRFEHIVERTVSIYIKRRPLAYSTDIENCAAFHK